MRIKTNLIKEELKVPGPGEYYSENFNQIRPKSPTWKYLKYKLELVQAKKTMDIRSCLEKQFLVQVCMKCFKLILVNQINSVKKKEMIILRMTHLVQDNIEYLALLEMSRDIFLQLETLKSNTDLFRIIIIENLNKIFITIIKN